jgi:hypothetical protein
MITNKLLNVAENNLSNTVLDAKYLYESEEFYSTGRSGGRGIDICQNNVGVNNQSSWIFLHYDIWENKNKKIEKQINSPLLIHRYTCKTQWN